MSGVKPRQFAARRVYRLRASERAKARGYVRFTLDRGDGAPRQGLAPLGGGLELLVRGLDAAVTVSVDPDEAMVEPLAWARRLSPACAVASPRSSVRC